MRQGLPDWADGSVECVYTCHLLEHLTYEDGLRLLREAHRVLRPGGALRVGVPDFRLFARAYAAGDIEFSRQYFERYCRSEGGGSPEGTPAEDPAQFEKFGPIGALLAIVYGWEHRAIYDEDVLRATLELAGFPRESLVRCEFRKSAYAGLGALDLNFEDHSLFIEARKAEGPSLSS